MPKRLLTAVSAAALYLTTASSAFAQASPVPSGFVAANLSPSAVIDLVIKLLFSVAGFLALCYLMYGGIRWITSRGDKVAVEAARKHIVAAVIGLVIVVSSFFILQVVFSILGIQNGNLLPTLPTVSPAP